MYTFNKNDNSYTFSSDDLENLVEIEFETDNESSNEDDNKSSEITEIHEKPKKIEVINGGNDLDISPVSNYIEVEKPKQDKKENIVVPEDKKIGR